MTNSGALTSAPGITRIRPSRLWLVVAALLLAGALACLAAGVTSIFAVDRQIQEFQRLSVPVQAQVTFSHPGRYFLYVEGPGHCCSFSTGSGGEGTIGPWSMKVALQASGGGPPIPIRTWPGAVDSYAVTGHQGQTALYFTIRHPGNYFLGVKDVEPRSVTDVAVGPRISAITLPVALILAALCVLGPAGLVIGGVTFFRRRSQRSQLAPPWSVPPLASDGAQISPSQLIGYEAMATPTARPPARTRRPAMLLVLGVVVLMAFLAGLDYLFHPVSGAPGSAPQPSAAAPAAHPARPAASAPSAHTRAAPAPGAAVRPRTSIHGWLTGLTALKTQMNNAEPPSEVTITPDSLLVTAGKLSRCSAELARLGPPPGPLIATYHQASQACADYERGAKCYKVAAPEVDSGQATNELNSCAADTNHGADLLGLAVAEGSFSLPQ